ncbi:hypothetical protein D9M68_759300 [compost metagenome]
MGFQVSDHEPATMEVDDQLVRARLQWPVLTKGNAQSGSQIAYGGHGGPPFERNRSHACAQLLQRHALHGLHPFEGFEYHRNLLIERHLAYHSTGWLRELATDAIS